MGTLLNVTFGIYVLHPVGWLLMLLIAALECVIASKFIGRIWWNGHISWVVILANLISGLVGVILSFIHNGGWWLVFGLPWASSVDWDDPASISSFTTYYLIAFILTIAIETPFLVLALRKKYGVWSVILSCLVANISSYLVAILIYRFIFNGRWL